MLAFFTDPYPNELLISTFSRYNYYADYNTSKDLFGCEYFSGSFTSRLDYLAKNLGGTYSHMELIFNHTLLPYYMIFKKSENIDKNYYEYLCIFKQLFFCPACLREDVEKYGEPYFHREHQLEGIPICSKHRIILKKYENEITWYSVVNYNRFDIRKIELNEIEILDEAKYDKLWQISKLSYDLLSCMPTKYINHDILVNYYKKVLNEKGFVNKSGIIDKNNLEKEIINFYGDEILCILDENYRTERGLHWLNNIFTKQTHPVRHLILINFLGKSINEILNDIDKDYTPFGDGPWICINTICNHYEKAVIKKVKVISENSLKEPYGIFECKFCGFKYSRHFNDDGFGYTFHPYHSKRVYKIKAIIDYGYLWYDTLKNYVINDNYSIDKISRKMNCSSYTILEHAKKLNIEVNQSVLENYKQQCIELIKLDPDISRTELYSILNYKYTQILKHDWKWLDNNVPKSKKKKT